MLENANYHNLEKYDTDFDQVRHANCIRVLGLIRQCHSWVQSTVHTKLQLYCMYCKSFGKPGYI